MSSSKVAAAIALALCLAAANPKAWAQGQGAPLAGKEVSIFKLKVELSSTRKWDRGSDRKMRPDPRAEIYLDDKSQGSCEADDSYHLECNLDLKVTLASDSVLRIRVIDRDALIDDDAGSASFHGQPLDASSIVLEVEGSLVSAELVLASPVSSWDRTFTWIWERIFLCLAIAGLLLLFILFLRSKSKSRDGESEEAMLLLGETLDKIGMQSSRYYAGERMGDRVAVAFWGQAGSGELRMLRRDNRDTLSVVGSCEQLGRDVSVALAGLHQSIPRSKNRKRKLIHRFEDLLGHLQTNEGQECPPQVQAALEALASRSTEQAEQGVDPILAKGLALSFEREDHKRGPGVLRRGFHPRYAAGFPVSGGWRFCMYDENQGSFEPLVLPAPPKQGPERSFDFWDCFDCTPDLDDCIPDCDAGDCTPDCDLDCS